jgi:hypothetical protein
MCPIGVRASAPYRAAATLQTRSHRSHEIASSEPNPEAGRNTSPDFSHRIGASGRGISESGCAPTTFCRFEECPDADRV